MKASRLLFVVSFVLLMVVGGLALLQFFLRDRTPLLNAAKLEQAEKAWLSKRVTDYDLVLSVGGDAQDERLYEAKVRDGSVVGLKSEGVELTPRGNDYSLDGLFDTMRRELEMASDASPARGQRRSALLKAQFHGTRGFPLKFIALAPNRQSMYMRVDRVLSADGSVLFDVATP